MRAPFTAAVLVVELGTWDSLFSLLPALAVALFAATWTLDPLASLIRVSGLAASRPKLVPIAVLKPQINKA